MKSNLRTYIFSIYYIMEDIKPKYTEAQKKATLKYRENNKEKINAQRKKYYQERKEKDPAFIEYKRQKAKEYYAKKKALKEQEKKEPVKEPEPVIETEPEPSTEPVKKSRKSKKAEPEIIPTIYEEEKKVIEKSTSKPKKEEIIEPKIEEKPVVKKPNLNFEELCNMTELGQVLCNAKEEPVKEKKRLKIRVKK